MLYYFSVFIHYCQRLLYDNDPVHSSPYCFTVLIHQFKGLLYDQPGRSSEVERNPKKNEHFIFLAGEGWWIGFESIDQPSQSPEVERNPKKKTSEVTQTCFNFFIPGGGYISQNKNVTLT